MYQIIAPTLFQNKICRLPGIGTLKIVPGPAQTDFLHSQIFAPTVSIDFLAEQEGEKIFNEFSAMTELLQKKIDEDGSVFLNGIGTFIKDAEGTIKFSGIQVDPVLFQPVAAERVIRENAEHSILVGDQQSSNVQMTVYFNEKPPLAKKQWWKIFAIILGAIGIGLLAFFLFKYGFSSLGNSNSI